MSAIASSTMPRMDTYFEYKDRLHNWWDQLTFTRNQKRALLIVASFVVISSTFFIFTARSQEVITPAPVPIVEAPDPEVIVDVAGGVLHPGVYTLAANSRVVDAIKAAGGIVKGADASDLNQARVMKDGEQIYVYPPAKSSGRVISRTAKVAPRGPVLLNRASAKELEALDGIGPVLAKRIVAYRTTNGPFATVDDLLKVKGIGANKFAQFKEKIRV